MTWITLPIFFTPFTAVAILLALECRRTTDNLGDLLRDLRLAGAVICTAKDVEDLAGVVCCVLHRVPLRALECSFVLHQSAVNRVAHVEWKQLPQYCIG